MIRLEVHPLLVARALRTEFRQALEATPSPSWLIERLSPSAAPWPAPNDELRAAVRDMLRHSGYKPTGRGKPASEYLRKAASEGTLGTINAAVDVCNVVSLHSGIPISVVDLERSRAPHTIGVARGAQAYVFNAAGQSIDVEGLLCLFDAQAACANAVKDSQRTKTHAGTLATLSILWGVRGLEAELERAQAWYRELSTRLGAVCEPVAFGD